MGKAVMSDDEDDQVELDEEDMEPVHGDAVDEDEEDEGPDEYEKDDFIVDNVDEEDEQEEEEEERQKKRKRKKKEEYVLDEDDYELLEDNNVIAPRRKGKFKRLKKAQRHAQGDVDEEEFFGTGKGGRTAEEKLKLSLFGDEGGPPLEDIDEEEEELAEAEDDEMADFIVHDEVDKAGVPVRQKKSRKKKPRQAPGVSSSALLEAHEIFGDVDDLMDKYKRGLSSSDRKETRIEDEFEPIVISNKYMTEKDDQIREIDVPERIQLYEESTPLDEKNIDDESAWIFNQLASGTVPFSGNTGLGNSISRDDIIGFLNLHHVQKLDVPFIAMYRKEECLSILKDPEHTNMDDPNEKASTLKWHKVLWSIQELHRKWLLLQKRKSALESYYEKRFDEHGRLYEEIRPTLISNYESIMKSLKAADSEREVDDVDTKFNLHFPAGEIDVDEGHYKRPKRKSLYSICSKAGLWEVASKFGNTSEQFGLQLSLEEMRTDELEDAKETPEELASNFTCAMFESPQQVLKGARHMAAVEISCEPCVRKYVRSNYLDIFELSTSPTPDGNAAIDPFHQFAEVKWLQRKPLSKFKDAQWLLIQMAEEEKLLQVTIKLPEDRLNKLMSDFNEYYLSDGVSKSAQLWNEQRKLILQDALFSFLLPSMEKEARVLLTSRAKKWLLMEYGKVLWNKVSVGPYQRKENDISSDDEAAPRVMACCWGPGNPATTFVILDSSGEVLDVLYTGSLTLRSQNVSDQQRKKNDQERVLKFMTEHQPHVLVLGAANMSCVRLKEDIYEIIFKMVEENPRDVDHDMDGLTIVYGDESLARLYENSRISSDQLPAQKGIVKRAVALGRYLQNPLAMVATLCGPGREILSWKLNPLDNFLTQDEKYTMIEQVMVDITNQVGLDINLAISHEWLFAPLQFISGLGPRKAAFLHRSLVRSGAILTRKDFMTAHGLSKKVFINAVGFLRVRPSGLAAVSSQLIDLLDDTRIHPESYILAQELAKDVFEADGANDDEDAMEMAIEHVRDRPTYLKNLDVEAYAKSKERENKIQTFGHIRRELIQGFQDWRKKYEELSKDEEFYMISGETEDTLAEGRIVQATVRRVQAQRAFCVLESGLTGILTKDDYSDDSRDISDLSERLNEGDILACKVKSISKNKYQVSLVCRESEMRNNRNQNIKNLDTYYHEDRRSLQTEQEKARKEKELARKHFKPRMIVHPRFQNITADEAMKFLSDKDPGESIIRPSSRGPSYLTLTLKVYDGVYAHKEVVEGGKERKDITSLLRIGKTLKIGDDTFEDLDEVMDRYVDPLVSHLKAMMNYRKFRQGTKAEVDELLKNEKLENPKLIVYGFGISHEHPGTFILTYIWSTNPHHEYVGVYPKGFKFRKHQFGSIDKLVAYFQKHINEPQHESGPSIRSVAAMVPMRSPATAGSSGASAGSGWGGSNNEGGWRGQSFDRDRSSTPSSRVGRSNYRSGGGRDGHPSGVARPSGGSGLCRGTINDSRGYNERRDSGFDGPTWGTGGSGSGSGGGGSSWAAGSGSGSGWGRESGGGSGGWGAAGANDNGSSGSGGSGGWGAAGAKDNEPSGWGGSGGWGAASAKDNEPSGWGGSGGWGAASAKDNEPSGWGGSGGWGAASAKDNEPSGWGGSGGWGAAGAKDNEPSGWGGSDSKKKGASDGTSGWGSQIGGGGW